MPTFVYKCNDCSSKYEVFHKSINNETEVICPDCGSVDYKKLMSAASIAGFSSSKSFNMPQMPPCANGSCNPGMCNMN